MQVVEVQVWVLIVFAVSWTLLLLNCLFGDLIAKLLYRHIKEKEKKENEDKEN